MQKKPSSSVETGISFKCCAYSVPQNRVNTCCFEFHKHGNQAQLLLTAKTFNSSTKSISVTFEINPSKKLGNLSGLGHVTQMVEQ